MQFVMSILAVAAVVAVWGWLCTKIGSWHAAVSRRRPTGSRRSDQLAQQRLPSGHQPPPGLGPLSPSERFLTSEAARGLRELQLFLADQRRV